MEKQSLNRFVSKYNEGLVESVKWESSEGSLTTCLFQMINLYWEQ